MMMMMTTTSSIPTVDDDDDDDDDIIYSNGRRYAHSALTSYFQRIFWLVLSLWGRELLMHFYSFSEPGGLFLH